MADFRLLVTGARRCTPVQARFVVQRLDAVFYSLPIETRLIVVQGRCPYGGVDKVAEDWAADQARAINEPHPADWGRHGKAAGPIRNTHMVGLGADRVMAFPDQQSRGTWDCLQKAVAAGIEPRLYPLHIYATSDQED